MMSYVRRTTSYDTDVAHDVVRQARTTSYPYDVVRGAHTTSYIDVVRQARTLYQQLLVIFPFFPRDIELPVYF